MVQDLPLAIDIETKEVLLALKDAHRYLAELKGVSKTIPNQNILINTLPLLEAKDSSEVENIITTHDALYKSSLFEDFIKDPASKEVHSYAQALRRGFEKIKETGLLQNSLIKEIQATIVNNSPGFRKTPGTQLQDSKKSCIYEPPQDPQVVSDLMFNLEKYINDDEFCELDPLIKMAIVHHQFESIHPFYDGNGRTGRIINILYLVQKELLEVPVLYLSSYIIDTKADYYRLLQQIRDSESNAESYKQAWIEWVIYILKGITVTAQKTISIVEQIRELMLEYKLKIRKEFSFYSQDLLNILFFHPYTKINFIESGLGVTRKTASKYLQDLVDSGYLKLAKISNLNFYVNERLFNIFQSA